MRKGFLASVLAVILGAVAFAQLPGPPVGVPQTQQSPAFGYNFAYTFLPNAATGAAFRIQPTLNLSILTGQLQDIMAVGGTIVFPNSTASGTTASALHVGTLTCTLNSATLTNCANMVVDAAPATGTNKLSMWVKGPAQFDQGINTLGATGVNASTGATQTITAAQCGQTFAWDRASGVNYTLPAPTVGCNFTFINTVTQTSGTNEVQTNTGTVFIQGGPVISGTTTAQFPCNGTTHISIKTNATTTGGIIGGNVRFLAISATEWQLDGALVGSGTVATACSTTT